MRKKKKDTTTFKHMISKAISILAHTKSYKKYLFGTIAVTLTYSIVQLGQPEVLYRGINAIERGDIPGLINVGIFAGVFVLIAMAAMVADRLVSTHSMNVILESVQTDVMKKSMQLTKRGFGKYKSGEFITHIINNAERGARGAFVGLTEMIKGALGLAVCLVYMSLISWKLALGVLLFNLLIRAMMKYFGRHLERAAKRFVGVVKNNNSFLIDMINNMMTVRTFGKSRYFNKMLRQKENETLRAGVAEYAWDNVLGNMIWMGQKTCEYLIIYGIGGYLVYSGTGSIAMMVSFIAVAQMMVWFVNSLMIFGYSSLKRAVPAIDNINEVLADADVEQGGYDIVCNENFSSENFSSETFSLENFAVRCENLGFAFGDTQILSGVNLTIKHGEHVMIRGKNGSGKTTLLNLISGAYRPTEGSICYGTNSSCDCCDISIINLDVLAKQYAYISQNSNILEGNVYENMALSQDFEQARCDDVLGKLKLENIKQATPKLLSQGEKQRLNIGRALYRKDSVCLILGDEIFANIDPANTQMIADMLQNEFADKTVIMVCHENVPYTFDRVIWVEDMHCRGELCSPARLDEDTIDTRTCD